MAVPRVPRAMRCRMLTPVPPPWAAPRLARRGAVAAPRLARACVRAPRRCADEPDWPPAANPVGAPALAAGRGRRGDGAPSRLTPNRHAPYRDRNRWRWWARVEWRRTGVPIARVAACEAVPAVPGRGHDSDESIMAAMRELCGFIPCHLGWWVPSRFQAADAPMRRCTSL